MKKTSSKKPHSRNNPLTFNVVQPDELMAFIMKKNGWHQPQQSEEHAVERLRVGGWREAKPIRFRIAARHEGGDRKTYCKRAFP